MFTTRLLRLRLANLDLVLYGKSSGKSIDSEPETKMLLVDHTHIFT